MELNIFPDTDTIIKCRTPEGKTIEVDALEIESICQEYLSEIDGTVPYIEYLKGIRDIFKSRYNYGMSTVSMQVILEAKDRIIEKVKKNTSQELDSVSSTESNQEQTES